MKRIIKITTLALTINATSLFADDYALTNSYRLLNDMKFAQKQQELIVNMSKALEKDRIDMKILEASQNQFTRVLLALSNGDSKLKIHGTDLPKFRDKINGVKRVWKREIALLNRAIVNRDLKDRAIRNLNQVMLKTSEMIELYNKSYSRFKLNSKISSIVYRHSYASRNQIVALNF